MAIKASDPRIFTVGQELRGAPLAIDGEPLFTMQLPTDPLAAMYGGKVPYPVDGALDDEIEFCANGYTLAQCQHCGQKMVGNRSLWRKTRGGYCSKLCFDAEGAEYRQWDAARKRRAYAAQRTPPEPRNCAHCGDSFEPKRSDAKTCSQRCRVAMHRKPPRIPEM